MSKGFAIVIAAVACLSLTYFLFAGEESATTQVPVDALIVSVDENEAVANWQLHDAIRPLASSNTPRRNASFLFYRQRLVPLDFPFDSTDGKLHPTAGWHHIRDGVLTFSLPGDSIANLQDGDLILELNGPMSLTRESAWIIFLAASLAAAFAASRANISLMNRWASPRWIPIAVALTATAVVVSLISTLWFPLPYNWQSSNLGRAIDRFDSIVPGLVLLIAVCSLIKTRFVAQTTNALSCGSYKFVYGSSLAITLLMFSFVRMLSWGPGEMAVWSPVETSSPFASSVAYSDAEGYLAGTYRLLTTGTLDQWNQRRPINACLLAMRIATSGGNIDFAKWLQAIAAAIVIAWLGREVARSFGWRSAIAAIALLVGCGRLFLITTLSEPLGFTLGCVAMIGLLRQLRTGCFVSGLAGLGFMAIAQGARPGALFVLPAIGLWVACVSSGRREYGGRLRQFAITFAVTAVVGGFTLAVNPMLSRIYGTGENLTGSNFAHTFLALATGQSWDKAVQEYQTQIDQQPNEKAVALFLYKEGMRQIAKQPQVFVGQLAKGFMQFSIETPRFLTAITARSTIDSLFPLLWLQVLGMLALVGSAAWRIIRMRRESTMNTEIWLWILVALGIAMSIPFVFLDGGLRVLIATWPAVLVWIATGLADDAVEHGEQGTRACKRWWLMGLLLFVILVAAVGPLVASRLGGYKSLRPAATDKINSMSIHRRMMGPGIWIGDQKTFGWSSRRQMATADWMRCWQTSGIGHYECIDMLLQDQPATTERFLFVQVFSPGDDSTRVLMVPASIAEWWLDDDRIADVHVLWCRDWPMAGRVIHIAGKGNDAQSD